MYGYNTCINTESNTPRFPYIFTLKYYIDDMNLSFSYSFQIHYRVMIILRIRRTFPQGLPGGLGVSFYKHHVPSSLKTSNGTRFVSFYKLVAFSPIFFFKYTKNFQRLMFIFYGIQNVQKLLRNNNLKVVHGQYCVMNYFWNTQNY